MTREIVKWWWWWNMGFDSAAFWLADSDEMTPMWYGIAKKWLVIGRGPGHLPGYEWTSVSNIKCVEGGAPGCYSNINPKQHSQWIISDYPNFIQSFFNYNQIHLLVITHRHANVCTQIKSNVSWVSLWPENIQMRDASCKVWCNAVKYGSLG